MATFDDLLPPTIPPRSRLYSLTPIGIGTAEVESLESYITRLALAHGVTPGVLMSREIVRLMQPEELEPGGYSRVQCQAHTVNGMGETAAQWISALERLTLRRDLSMLTLRSWRHVIPNVGLIRKKKAWCSYCYGEDPEPYERLLWLVRPVTVCAKHRVSLTTECPNCSAKLPVLGFTAKVGFCVRCGAGLKKLFEGATSTPVSTDAFNREISNAVQLGDLLATTARDVPVTERVVAVMAELRRLCRLHGVYLLWEGHKKLSRGQIKPSLPTLLAICEIAGVSLRDFMAAPLDKLEVSPKRLRRRPIIRHFRPRFDATVGEPRLRELVERNLMPPPSLGAVAVSMNIHVNGLYRFFPELCRIIACRHREFVRSKAEERRQRLRDEVWKVATMLAEAGIAVTEARVATSSKKPGSMRDPVARQAYREFVAQRTT